MPFYCRRSVAHRVILDGPIPTHNPVVNTGGMTGKKKGYYDLISLTFLMSYVKEGFINH